MNLYKNLAKVQSELKAPKNQFNNFGKYNYRSCEDILEAAKPLCLENGLVLNLSDTIINVGNSNYVEATASVIDIETGDNHFVTASARESVTKKGMDDSQITGTASSYARKYALNGLFSIDDTKDADTDSHTKQRQDTNKPKQQNGSISESQVKRLNAIAYGKGYDFNSVKKAAKKKYNIDNLESLSKTQYDEMCKGYENAESKK